MRKILSLGIVVLMLLSVVPAMELVSAQGAENMWVINSKELVWKDAIDDQGHQKDNWLPRGTSTHFDLKEFRITTDGEYVYFLAVFNDMSNIQLGYNGATFMAIAVDYKAGGETWLAGNSGLQVNSNAKWDYQIVVNLADPSYSGDTVTVDLQNAGNWGKIFYIVDNSWSQLAVLGAKMSVNITNNVIELAIPKSLFGGTIPSSLNVTVMTAPGWADGDGNGGVWGEAFDFVSDKTSDEEKSNGVVDYYINIDTSKVSGHSPITVDGDVSDWPGEFVLPKPELTVSVSSNVLDVERWQPANITLSVKNMGEVDAKNVTVYLYDNDNLIKSWFLNISANSEIELSYLYTYSSAWGTHTLKAVVDPDNEIEEVNEDNNIDTVDIEVGRVAKTQNDMVKMGMYVWPKLYMPKYNETLEMVTNLSQMSLPRKYDDQIKAFRLRLNESMQLYQEGNKSINMPHYELRGAMKIFSAYSRLLRLQKDINEFLENLKFKKKIDGLLNDWNETSLVAQNKEAFGAGAHLDSLYVDYDDNYLYIGLKTENTETWRIAYGIGLDYKNGGYTGDTDAWDRKMGFDRGIDAEIYFYWNGPFFGEEGSNTITQGKIAIWNGANWMYYPAFKNASIKYVGGDMGLQTLEMAIPWELLGGKPEKIYISAWIAGANPGDSAVNSLPDDPSMHDSDNEWGDQDKISTFAEVLIK